MSALQVLFVYWAAVCMIFVLVGLLIRRICRRGRRCPPVVFELPLSGAPGVPGGERVNANGGLERCEMLEPIGGSMPIYHWAQDGGEFAAAHRLMATMRRPE